MECKILGELVELEEYSIYSVYSTSETEIASWKSRNSWNNGDRSMVIPNGMISVPFELE